MMCIIQAAPHLSQCVTSSIYLFENFFLMMYCSQRSTLNFFFFFLKIRILWNCVCFLKRGILNYVFYLFILISDIYFCVIFGFQTYFINNLRSKHVKREGATQVHEVTHEGLKKQPSIVWAFFFFFFLISNPLWFSNPS